MLEYIPGIPIMRPYVDLDNQGYWDAVKRHELVIQRCKVCDKYYQPPRPMCPECHSLDSMEWVPSAGKGRIYSYVIFTSDRMAYPALKIPYAVVLVELEEGVRLTSHVVDTEPQDIYIGMPVEVVFRDFNNDFTLYMFKKRED